MTQISVKGIGYRSPSQRDWVVHRLRWVKTNGQWHGEWEWVPYNRRKAREYYQRLDATATQCSAGGCIPQEVLLAMASMIEVCVCFSLTSYI